MTETQIKNLIRKIKATSKEKSELEKQLEKQIKQAACQACYCSIELFESRKRKENAVFARYLFCWYYFTKKINQNITNVGYIVNLDHATVLRGINIIQENKENNLKYLKPAQRIWVNEFNKLTDENQIKISNQYRNNG